MRLARRPLLLGLPAAVAARSALAQGAGPGATAGGARLAVVVLRGALDGLEAAPPYGDPGLAALRGSLAIPGPGQENGALDLGGHVGLHPALAGLHARFLAGEALVLHAVAGPWRSRSHFEAQDLLENGGEPRREDGWLNRALSALPDAGPMRAAAGFSGPTPLLLQGATPTGSFTGAAPARATPETLALLEAWHGGDAAWGPALREGLRARAFAAAALAGQPQPPAPPFVREAVAAGRLLAHAEGPRVAVLELGGWDTHAAQNARLRDPLRVLDAGLSALREGAGAAWARTAVLVMTEFGRTARMNGAAGTDHGTAGVAFLLGGAVAGGRVVADWPGLAEGRLFENRDLAPTLDLQRITAALLRDHLRLPPAALAAAFPGQRPDPLPGLLRG